MIIEWVGPALYVRTAYDSTMDKVWRVQVAPDPEPGRSQGVVDLLGERLIPRDTPEGATSSAFETSDLVLRGGGDESPPIWIDRLIVGGNHRLDGRDTIAGLTTEVIIDGVSGVPEVGAGRVDGIAVVERYQVLDPHAVRAGDPPVPAAEIEIRWTFGEGGLVYIDYAVTALADLDDVWLNGLQPQRPVLAEGQSMTLFVPESDLAAGVDMGALSGGMTQRADDWSDPTRPPELIIQRVSDAGGASHDVVAGFLATPDRSDLSQSFFISSAGKLYPRAAETPLAAGSQIEVSSFYGTVAATDGAKWQVDPLVAPYVTQSTEAEDTADAFLWSDRVETYSIAGDLVRSVETFETGETMLTVHDHDKQASWSHVVIATAADGTRDYRDTHYDDGTRVFTDHNQDGSMPWETRITGYVDGAIDFVRVEYEGGGFDVRQADAGSSNEVSRFSLFDDQGRRDFVNDYAEDGTRKLTDFDQAGDQAFDVVEVRYDASGAAVSLNTGYDDGTRILKTFDPHDQEEWHTLLVGYDALGRADALTALNDDGSRRVTNFDEADAFLWTQHIQEFDPDGTLLAEFYV